MVPVYGVAEAFRLAGFTETLMVAGLVPVVPEAGETLSQLPVLTAVVVGARLTGSLRRKERPLSDHVIVVGLGNVGTRVVGSYAAAISRLMLRGACTRLYTSRPWPSTMRNE